MNNKIVCQKCGQIYDDDRPKCPLCGAPSGLDTSAAAAPRKGGKYLSKADKKELRREEEAFLREEEARYRRLKRQGESDAPAEDSDTKIPAGFVVVSILLLLAALVIGGSFLLWKSGAVKMDIYDRLSGKTTEPTVTETLPVATVATETVPVQTTEETTEAPETTEEPIELPEYEADLVVLVNDDNPISEDYEIEDLVTLGSGAKVSRVCLEDLQAMMDDCRAEKHYPLVTEGYDEDAEDTDEFRTGLALHIFPDTDTTPDAESQMESETILWLQEHSWEYGFIVRFPEGKEDLTDHDFEPWHFRYVGKTVAEYLHENDLCLEEFNDLLIRAGEQ